MSKGGPVNYVPQEFCDRFAENLAELRIARGLSQEALGLLAGLHRTEISLLERGGRVPRVPTALRLSAALEVSLERLLLGLEWSPAPLDYFPGPDGRTRPIGGDGRWLITPATLAESGAVLAA